MEIIKRDAGDILIYDVEGEIDLYHAPKLRDMIKESILEGKLKFILNLEKVSYIDSFGIGVLISSLTNLKTKQGNLFILKMGPQVKKVFDLSRLSGFFSMFEDEFQAIESFA
jgi:anti-sigma B factor antagonist